MKLNHYNLFKMRKIFQSFLLIFLHTFIFGQSILVNPAAAGESALDAEALTLEVLVDGGGCASISNFNLTDNPFAQFPNQNRSWGYFQKGNSDFPFESGIILTSGFARRAQGPDNGIVSDGTLIGWADDPSDSDAVQLADFQTENTTIFEFDFIPYGNEISFNYIFASEEYPDFSCNPSFNDVFGFIISGPGITPDPGLSGKNIALLPNGNTVTINNVNDEGCGDEDYFVPGANENPYIDIQYGGRTIPLTAYSEVIPGETYHIRLLVSDTGDHQRDSAVFLEEGSFNLGGSLIDLEGMPLGDSQSLCNSEEFTMFVDIDASNADFQWYFEGQPISGATNQEHTATESGHYSVEVVSDSCNAELQVELIFDNSPPAQDVADFKCTPDGSFTYNLHDFEQDILGMQNVSYTFYNSMNGADQEIDSDEIINTENFEVSGQQTVYVRVENAGGCYAVVELSLETGIGPETQNAVLENCSIDEFSTYHLPDANENIVNDVSGLNFSYYDSFSNALNATGALPDDYNNISADQTIYVRVENAGGCFTIAEVELTTNMNHVELATQISVCDDPYRINDQTAAFDLTQMNPNIESALGGTGYTIEYYLTIENARQGINPIQTPAEFENTSNPQTIYARAYGNDSGCAGTASFQIEVLPVPEPDLDESIAYCDMEEEKYFEFTGDFSSYTWYDTDGNVISNSNSVTFEQEGMHTLEVTGAGNECPARRNIEVIFDHAPVITHIEVDGNTVSVFPIGGEGPYEYSYNNGLRWHDYFILTDVPAGIHSMLVKSKYGCISEAKLFGVLGIPNVITPNGDGYNDYWEIRALEMYPDAYIKIFDRYGKMFMDRKMGPNFQWDGTYLGRPLPSGDYWYIITIEEEISISGHVAIRNH